MLLRTPQRFLAANVGRKFIEDFPSEVFFPIFTKNIDMIIERTTKEIIFRLPYSTNVDDLQDLTDLLEYKEIVKKSKASQKDVDSLVATIKKGRWDKTKQQLNA